MRWRGAPARAAAAVAALVSVPTAHGAVGTTVGIVPSGGADAVRIDLPPGGSAIRSVEVVNPGDAVQRVRLDPLDAMTTDDGAFTLAPDGVPPAGVGRWTRVARPVLTLPPRARVTVPVMVRVPRDATPGDHSGGVAARLVTPREASAGGVGVTIVERVGVRVHVRVRGALRAVLGVEDVTADARVGGGVRRVLGLPDRVRIRFVARNAGNLRQEGVTGTVSVWRGRERVAASGFRVGDLLPGETRAVSGELGLPRLPQGDYRVRVEMKGVSATARVARFSIGWGHLGVTALLLLATGAVVVVWRPARRRVGR